MTPFIQYPITRLVLLVCFGVSATPIYGQTNQAVLDVAAKKHKVRAVRDITYYDVKKDPDAYRHKLDVYRPVDEGSYPALLFLHGGAWVFGSKDDVLGVYGFGTIARRLAERGMVVVIANYRLSPGVQHPEHIKDVARAFAWMSKDVAKYGGDPQRLFVSGHSAGGHLAALLATDDAYLKQVGYERKSIRGVIGISGVYRVDDFDVKVLLGDTDGPVQVKFDVRPLARVFGDDPQAAQNASPINHVRPGLPPFLLLTGGWDYPPMRRMARDFSAALKQCNCAVVALEIPRHTHETLLFDIPNLSIESATADAIVEFINQIR